MSPSRRKQEWISGNNGSVVQFFYYEGRSPGMVQTDQGSPKDASLVPTEAGRADWEQGAQEPSPRRYIQLAKIAKGEQAFWFLEQIKLDRNFLEDLVIYSRK